MLPLLLPALAPLVGDILSRLIPDKAAADKAAAEINAQLTLALIAANTAQVDLNRQEAAHQSIFIAGWRPFIGWVCGAALAYQFLFRPLLPVVANVLGFAVPLTPALDDVLWELVTAMLGLSGLRTFEKRRQAPKG